MRQVKHTWDILDQARFLSRYIYGRPLKVDDVRLTCADIDIISSKRQRIVDDRTGEILNRALLSIGCATALNNWIL